MAGGFGFAGVLSECFGEEAGYAQVVEPFCSFGSGYLKGGALRAFAKVAKVFSQDGGRW